jgi:predicted MPP superfamily phosphohydrolase
MRLGFLVFLLVLTGLLYLVNRYALHWATRAFGLSVGVRRALTWLLSLAVVGMFAGRLLSFVAPGAAVPVIVAVSSTIELAVLLSVALLLPADGLRLVARLVARLRQRILPPKATPAAAPAETRRAFLTQAAAGSAFLVGGSSALYGALAGRADYTIEEVPIKLPGLSRAFDGFSIVQLSDLHIGDFVGDPELAAAEALVKSARPDLIVLTGDLLDNNPRLAPRLGQFVRRLGALARHGVVAIPGNHDFFAGIDPVVEALRAGGARVLRNHSEVIGDRDAGFALLGVDDVWATRFGGGPDVGRAIRELPRLNGQLSPARDLPRVLLCHNPSYFEQAAGQVALQLSGHTHGGQINLLVRPADFLLPNGWVAGRYTLAGSQLYVNRGFGTVGPPARLGASPEITRLVLTV